MRALLYPRFAVPGAVLPREVLSRVPSWGLYPPRLCRPPPSVDPLGEHYAQALVMRVSFFWGSFRGSAGGSVSYFCHSGEISDRTPEPSDKGLVSWHREYFALKGKKHHARESEQARHGTVRPE